MSFERTLAKPMKKVYQLFLTVFVLCACDDNINISNRTFNIFAPQSGEFSDTTLIQFIWEEVSDINYYELKVSSVLENGEETIILDTATLANSFLKILEPGTYFAQVFAHNNISTASSHPISFVVNPRDSLLNFINTKAKILAPAPLSSYKTNEDILVLWETDIIDETSGQMELKLVSPSFQNIREIVLENDYHWSQDRITNLQLDSGTYELMITPYKYVSGVKIFAQSDTTSFTVGM